MNDGNEAPEMYVVISFAMFIFQQPKGSGGMLRIEDGRPATTGILCAESNYKDPY